MTVILGKDFNYGHGAGSRRSAEVVAIFCPRVIMPVMLKLSFHDLNQEPSGIEALMPNELFVLDLTSDPVNDWGLKRVEILTALEKVSKHTRKFRLLTDKKIFWELFSYDEWTAQVLGMGLEKVHLIMELDVPTYTFAGLDYQSPYIHDWLYAIRHMNEKVPQLKILPCLACPQNQIHHLGPLIAEFFKMNYPEIVLIPPARRTEKAVMAYRQLFEYLRLRGINNMWLSFDYFHKDYLVWNMQTFNSFCGPQNIHFDISNKCTHSCNFCGLYGPDAMEHTKRSNEENRANIRRLMTATLDFEKGRGILEKLPETTRFIQFGGIGDPMTHPHFLDFVRIARERGFSCEVLSNMDYFTEESLVALSQLGSKDPGGLHFFANVSGSTAEVYLKTRPRQNIKNYERVMKNLFRLREEREKNDGHGVYFTMMNVLNRTNYQDAESYVRLSKEIGAQYVFLKPMEIHIEFQSGLLVPEEDKLNYSQHIHNALTAADEIGLPIHDRESLEKVLELHPIKGNSWQKSTTNLSN